MKGLFYKSKPSKISVIERLVLFFIKPQYATDFGYADDFGVGLVKFKVFRGKTYILDLNISKER